MGIDYPFGHLIFYNKLPARSRMRSIKLPREGQMKEYSSTNGVKLFPPGGRMRSIKLPRGGQIKEYRLSVRTPDLL
jgi:hypothetical protein